MKKLLVSIAAVLILGCTPAARTKALNTAYDMGADKLACVLVATITEEDVIMKICQIEEKFRPVVRELLAGKAAASRAGAAAPPACSSAPKAQP